MSDFIDRATATVLNVRAFRSRLDPDSEWGAAMCDVLPRFAPTDHGGWSNEIEATKATERWAQEHVDALQAVRNALAQLPTLQKTISHIDLDKPLGDPELFELKRFLFQSEVVLAATKPLNKVCNRWHQTVAELRHAIHPEAQPSQRFRLSDQLDPALAKARADEKAARKHMQELRAQLEEAIIQEHGGQFDVRGRYQPHGALPKDKRLELTSQGCFLADKDLKKRQGAHEESQDEVARIESEVRAALTDLTRPKMPELTEIRAWLGAFDLRLAKGRLREEIRGSWSIWGDAFKLHCGYDPSIPEVSPERVDFEFDRAAVVTGPNMGGKSSLLRAVGLCVWAHQHALPVPAKAFECVPVHQLIYVGAEERNDAVPGLSSFGHEVTRLKEHWDVEHPSLFLLDEVGRGTHPEEGGSIASEVIRRLSQGNYVIAATHFPAVASMEGVEHFRIRGLDHERLMSADGAMERRLRQAMSYAPESVEAGDSVPRDARVVARALGLPIDE